MTMAMCRYIRQITRAMEEILVLYVVCRDNVRRNILAELHQVCWRGCSALLVGLIGSTWTGAGGR